MVTEASARIVATVSAHSVCSVEYCVRDHCW